MAKLGQSQWKGGFQKRIIRTGIKSEIEELYQLGLGPLDYKRFEIVAKINRRHAEYVIGMDKAQPKLPGSLSDVPSPSSDLIQRSNNSDTSPNLSVGVISPLPTTVKPLTVSEYIPINPPTLDGDLWNDILEHDEVDLTLLSDLIQTQIQKVQSNCSGATLKCGHFNNDCGFGCQVHHRVACLMISYSLSVPLIHDEMEGWSFTQKWSDLFLPLGSNCSKGPQTIHWTWDLPNLYESPLTYGIPVTAALANVLNKTLEHPFAWLVGQFMKYSLKLNAQTERDVKRDMAGIHFERPIIGLHVRRTDKITEAADSHHEIQDYMISAEDNYKKLLNLTKLNGEPLKPTVFIASDDAATVVQEAQKKYSNWTVLGFPSQPTLKNPISRKDALYEIVRDVFILSECNYAICGLSSNVCRLLLEMLCFKQPDGYNYLKSLEYSYSYPIHYNNIQNFKVVGISGNDPQFLKRKPPKS